MVSDVLQILFRWLHIAAGVLWIGLLYWFNLVHVQFAAALDGETKRKVVPELLPRALYFFRWGAAATWITGFLLLMLVFYHGGLMFEADSEKGWGVLSIVLVLLAFSMFAPYDLLAGSALGRDMKFLGAAAFILIGVFLFLMKEVAGFSYRAYVIHLGTMFGTIMAANVWMRIWPAQRKIIAAVKEGRAPDQDLVTSVALRSRHNLYLSVPLLYTMITMHTVVPGADSSASVLVAILVGWWLVALVLRKAARLPGA